MENISALFRRENARAMPPLLSSDDISFLARWPFYWLAARALPEWCWPKLVEKITSLGRAIAPRQPGRVQRRMSQALNLDAIAAQSLHHKSLHHRAEHLLQVARMRADPGWAPPIHLEGEEHLAAALATGRGAVLWVAHFAYSSLLTKVALSRARHPVWHLSRPEHGFSKSRFGIAYLNPIRAGTEDRFLAGRLVLDRARLGSCLLRARRLLGANALVSMTAGAWEGRGMARGALLGGQMVLATGAPGLAHQAGAALLPVFTLRQDNGEYLVCIGASLLPHGVQDRGAAILGATTAFLALHEPLLCCHPAQWGGWKYLEGADR